MTASLGRDRVQLEEWDGTDAEVADVDVVAKGVRTSEERQECEGDGGVRAGTTCPMHDDRDCGRLQIWLKVKGGRVVCVGY